MDGYVILKLIVIAPSKYGKAKTSCISANHVENKKEAANLRCCDYY
jgi:hypothetical protein